MSLREIEKALGGKVKKSALGELLKGKPGTSKKTAATIDAPAEARQPGDVGAEALPDQTPLAFLESELGELRTKVIAARDGTTRAHLDAVRGYAEIAERVKKMQPPPPPPEPDEDPANLAKKRELRARLEALAEETMRTPDARATARAHLDRLEVAAAEAVGASASPALATSAASPP